MEQKIKLIEELKGYHHGFLSEEGCKHFLEPFKIPVKMRLAEANPQDFKGLSLWDKNGKPMDEAWGMDGLSISESIVSHYKLKVQMFFGRGFQHQANCEVILKRLHKQETKKCSKCHKSIMNDNVSGECNDCGKKLRGK